MNIFLSKILLILLVLLHSGMCVIRGISTCHNVLDLRVRDGVVPLYTFTWLGFGQFEHVTTKHRHSGRYPRVLLVQQQFALGTAMDLLHAPKNFKLETIIFGEYEREEDDCGLSRMQLYMGVRCQRAYIEMGVLDVVPHPEFSRFGLVNSLALVKFVRPLESGYAVPICLPTFPDRKRKHKTRVVFMVDYMKANPVDIENAKIAKTSLKLLTHKECRRHRQKYNLDDEGMTHVLCTSGCGVRAGAPIVSHAVDGSFELVGVGAGGGACTQGSMRRRLNLDPPLYIDVYPYNAWIVNVITANTMPKPFSPRHMLMDANSDGPSVFLRKTTENVKVVEKAGWTGRNYRVGNSCYEKRLRYSDEGRKLTAFFYLERFSVITSDTAKLTVKLQISAGVECTIVCVNLIMPNKLAMPKVEGISEFNVTITFETQYFPKVFEFALGMFGKNTTEENFGWFKERDVSFW